MDADKRLTLGRRVPPREREIPMSSATVMGAGGPGTLGSPPTSSRAVWRLLLLRADEHVLELGVTLDADRSAGVLTGASVMNGGPQPSMQDAHLR